MPYLLILAAWLILLFCAALLGAARDRCVIPRLGEGPGRAVMSMLFIGFVFLAAFALNRISPLDDLQALTAGLIWLVLTVAWEMFMGRVLMKLHWREILAEYNILRGRLWPLVLAATFLAPHVTR